LTAQAAPVLAQRLCRTFEVLGGHMSGDATNQELTPNRDNF
jgi:hypothetical protein